MAAKPYTKATPLHKLQTLCTERGLDAFGDANELRARLDENYLKQKVVPQRGLNLTFSDDTAHHQNEHNQIGEPNPIASVPAPEASELVTVSEEVTSNAPTFSRDEQPAESVSPEAALEKAVEPVSPPIPVTAVAHQQAETVERVKLGEALYLQLHRDNVGQYFMRGAFYPNALELNQQYNENRAEDILTRFPGYLVLASGIVGDFEENQLLIELQLREEDTSNSEVIGELCFLNSPLPISRIKSISFATESAQSSFYNNVEAFRDYFFPQELSRIIRDDIPTVKELDSLLQTRLPAADVAKWSEAMERFDRVLGMFGYMKIASVLRANYEGSLVDYPEEFMGAWHEINTAIEKPERAKTPVFKSLLRLDIEQGQGAIRAKRLLFFELINVIYSGEQISYATAIKLINQVGLDFKHNGPVGKEAESQDMQLQELRDAAEEFHKLATPGLTQYQNALKRFERSQNELSSSSNLPLTALVLLGKFSNRERANTDKQAALNHFAKSGAAFQKADLAHHLAIMGLYYGYQSLVREMGEPFIERPDLVASSQDMNRLRFRMEIPSDRRLVESVFRFSADGGKPTNDPLSYLNSTLATSEVPSIKIAEHQALKQSQAKHSEPAPAGITEPPFAVPSEAGPTHTWQTAYPNGVGPDSLLYTMLMKLRPESFIKSVAEIEALLDSLPAPQRAVIQELTALTRE